MPKILLGQIKITATVLAVLIILFPSVSIAAVPLSSDDLRSLDLDTVNYKSNYAGEQQSLSCGTTAVGTPTENEKNIWVFLTQTKNLSSIAAAALMGNIKSESRFDTQLIEFGYKNTRGEISVDGTPTSHDDYPPPDAEFDLQGGKGNGQPGFGIVQWSGGRKQPLRDLAAQRGVLASDLNLQLDNLWRELTTDFKNNVLDPISDPNIDLATATTIVLNKFESPRDVEGNKPVRIGYANEELTKFDGTVSGASVSTSGGCTTGAGGVGGTVDIAGGKYAFPLSPQKHPIGGITDNQTLTIHHDRTPAFDLSHDANGHEPVYAVHDGTVVGVGQQAPDCFSLNLVTNEADGEWHYWYGHIKEVSVNSGQTVTVGQQLGITANASENSQGSCGGGGFAHLHIDRGINHGPGGYVCLNQVGVPGDINDCVNGTGRDAGFIVLLGRIYAGLP